MSVYVISNFNLHFLKYRVSCAGQYFISLLRVSKGRKSQLEWLYIRLGPWKTLINWIFMDLPETHLSVWWPYCVGWAQFVPASVKSCSFSQRTQVLYVAFWKTSSVQTWICKVLRKECSSESQVANCSKPWKLTIKAFCYNNNLKIQNKSGKQNLWNSTRTEINERSLYYWLDKVRGGGTNDLTEHSDLWKCNNWLLGYGHEFTKQ